MQSQQPEGANNFWKDHFAGERSKEAIWSAAKRKGSRADLPYEYLPASDTAEFWLYAGDLVAEIVPGGFQFTHICEDGGTCGAEVMTARRWAEELVKEFAGRAGGGGYYLDGTPGLPGEIRALPDGRALIVWRSDSLEILENVLFTYGACYSEAIMEWLAEEGFESVCLPDGSFGLDLGKKLKPAPKQ